MRLEQSHGLGRQEAVRRLDRIIDGLVQQPPGGVTIENGTKNWNGDRMDFAFTVAKAGFSVPITGAMDVSEDRVTIDAELPVFVRAVFGEDRIKQIISHELETVLR